MKLLGLLAFLPVVIVASNRTSCFRYISCFEQAQKNLRDCVGGTAVALILESKDGSAADFMNNRGRTFNHCQDRLVNDVVDFESMEVLVNEDARECFEKLPGSTKNTVLDSSTCDYSSFAERDHYGKDTTQCVMEFASDRQFCESQISCCPDVHRCGERMNAVSVAYQHAKSKGALIVSSMLNCVMTNDRSATEDGLRLLGQRSSLRNPGLPFFRPDTATEERILRRLSLTSQSTLEARRSKFSRRYQQVRALLSQRVRHSSLSTPSPSELRPTEETTVTQENNLSGQRKMNIVRNLLRNANDAELTSYVGLIVDGNFDKLSELEKEKLSHIDTEEKVNIAMDKMKKIRDAIKAALATKTMKTIDYLQTASATTEAPQEEKDNEWANTDDASLAKVLAQADEETLFRAKKFAGLVGETLSAQKELILTNDNTFTGNGLPVTRTASTVASRLDRDVHDFTTLSQSVGTNEPNIPQESTTIVSEVSTTEATVVEKKESLVDMNVEAAIETTGATEAPKTGETGVTEVSTIEATVVEKKETLVDMNAEAATETTEATEAPKTGETRVTEMTKEAAGGENTTVSPKEETKEQEQTAETKTEIIIHSEPIIRSDVPILAVTEEAATVAETTGEDKVGGEVVTVSGDTETATLTTDVPVSLAELKQILVEEKQKDEIKRSLEAQPIIDKDESLPALVVTPEAQELLKEIATQVQPEASVAASVDHNTMSNMIEELKTVMVEKSEDPIPSSETVAVTTESAPAETPEDPIPSSETVAVTTESAPAETPKSEVEGSGEEDKVPETTVEPQVLTTITEETTTVAAVEPVTTSATVGQQNSYCVAYANCDEMVKDYADQCDRKFSKDIISHGIEDAEIVAILHNASVSHHEIVYKACLRPLDRAAHSQLKQLLIIERGVRKACLELGRNKAVLTDEESSVCANPPLSTQAVDNFLAAEYRRSDENLLTCHAKLAPLRDTCHAVSNCCASTQAHQEILNRNKLRPQLFRNKSINKKKHGCDNYIASSPVRLLKDESIDKLVTRQNECEKRMLETLKYIHEKLQTRRRRVL